MHAISTGLHKSTCSTISLLSRLASPHCTQCHLRIVQTDSRQVNAASQTPETAAETQHAHLARCTAQLQHKDPLGHDDAPPKTQGMKRTTQQAPAANAASESSRTTPSTPAMNPTECRSKAAGTLLNNGQTATQARHIQKQQLNGTVHDSPDQSCLLSIHVCLAPPLRTL
jgi:hypothetical protein